MAYPATVRAIEAELARLAADHPSLCTRTVLPNRSHEGRSISLVTVGAREGGGRPALLTGGVHAREWVPPDALVSLLDRLLRAYVDGTAFEVPAFTDTRAAGGRIGYPAAAIAAADVRRIVERLELHVVALSNPDGRAFTQAAPANALWRKNRRPPPPGSSCVGVDLNRNHDVAWDFERYYDDAGDAAVSASKDPCDFQVYIGPSVASEPESRNVAGVLRDRRIEFYVDVHSFSRKILFPWGMDDNQTRDPSQNFRNPAWDGRRDGAPGGPYGEFIPATLRDEHVRIGAAMRDAILEAAGGEPRARARSRYDVEPSLALYPTTGTSSDFAASLQFQPEPPAQRVISYTLECGSDADGEGGFQPVPAIYPKIEREVHLSLMALLLAAAQ
ncbi:MAG TPA: M14 family zinc carboxypeptidase [Solirubrobacteraceae bacterium]|nr:M14 family zinc carboxypeptidase [Solirubrobacteraceae bacterium]